MSPVVSSPMKMMKLLPLFLSLSAVSVAGDDCIEYALTIQHSATTCSKAYKIDSAQMNWGADFMPICEDLCTGMEQDQGLSCTHFGIDETGKICVFYGGCDRTRVAKKVWDTYERRQVECPAAPTEMPAPSEMPEPTEMPAPTDAPQPVATTPQPADTTVTKETPVTTTKSDGLATEGPAPEPELPGPVEIQWIYPLISIMDQTVCADEHMITEHCTGCHVDDCKAGCSATADCAFFAFTNFGGVCNLYNDCERKTTKQFPFRYNTYKKSVDPSMVAPIPEAVAPIAEENPVPEFSPVAEVVPEVPVTSGAAPLAFAPEPVSSCEPEYVMRESGIARTCAKDWVIERKYNENADVALCSERCTEDDTCKFFGLSTRGTCVTFSGCDTDRETGQIWDTYERVEPANCNQSSSDASEDCLDEPFTSEVFIGPDAHTTCDKSQMIRKEANGGATEESCALACEVQNKTWQEGDDDGKCTFYGLSSTGVCILYDGCTMTRHSNKSWTTWEMTPPESCDDAAAPAPTLRRFVFDAVKDFAL